MPTAVNDVFQKFMLDPGYRVARYVVFIGVFTTIMVSLGLNNIRHIHILRNQIIEWVLYFLTVFIPVTLNVFVLVPRYLLKNRPTAYFMSALFLALGLMLFLGSAQGLILHEENSGIVAEVGNFLVLNMMASFVSLGLLIIGTSSAMLLKHWMKSNRRINELEAATLQSELDMLKNQINPHFLLNTLNNANVLIWKNKEEARLVLSELENLLRYQLKDTSREDVLLSFDIRFLNDYLNLEKIRRDNFEFSIEVEGDTEGVRVPSLLFIPFVENAVKHNHDSKHLSYVSIRFEVANDKLVFGCENSKPTTPPIKNKVGGLGLKNIRRRLALLYPDRHEIVITDEKTKYRIQLKIENVFRADEQ